MSWPRGSLFTALLVLSIPLASADTITVNTTTDDYADNSLCSLREAVEYFNLDKPVNGFQGCKTDASSDASTVSVPANSKPYEINASTLAGTEHDAIFIRRSITITGAGMQGDEKTLIQVNGPHRAFILSSVRAIDAPACAGSATCQSSATAPVLDPTSDTSSGNYLTTNATPTFTGHLVVPAGTTNIQIGLYDKPAGSAADADPVAIGTALVDMTTGNWSIIANTLKEGLHKITYTIAIDDVAESTVHSDPTYLGVQAADDPVLQVSLSQMEIQGCNETDCANAIDTAVTPISSTSANGLVYRYPLSNVAGQGGIFYSNEVLRFSAVNIHGGVASVRGGAVYSAAAGVVGFATSKVHGNKAPDGGAIYAEQNAVSISQSLVTENSLGTSPAVDGAIITLGTATVTVGTTDTTLIENSTISGNSGLALSLLEGAAISASTIVNNTAGLDFNGKKVSVYKTILAGNPDPFLATTVSVKDCLNLPPSADIDFQFNVGMQGGGCGTAPVDGMRLLRGNDVSHPEEKLFASLDATGKCKGYTLAAADPVVFRDMGLLCPLAVRSDDDVTAYHMPRILAVYESASESPIVAKAADISVVGSTCSSSDQRTQSRRPICDVGAVELQPVQDAVLSGDAISYGQTYSEALDSELGDEELFVPTAALGSGSCPAFALTAQTDRERLIPGCPWITLAPAKGTVVFNPDGTYTYRPNSNFHGFDRFSFRVVTNLSKLNDSFDSQSRVVNAQIIMEPTHGLSAYSTAGAADLWWLFALAGLGGVAGYAGRRGQK